MTWPQTLGAFATLAILARYTRENSQLQEEVDRLSTDTSGARFRVTVTAEHRPLQRELGLDWKLVTEVLDRGKRRVHCWRGGISDNALDDHFGLQVSKGLVRRASDELLEHLAATVARR